MKRYLIPVVFLCAFSGLWAANYQTKAGGAVTSTATFNVWNGSAWVTATTAPGVNDSITSFASTGNLQMPTGASITNINVTLSGITGATIVPTATSNEVTISGTVGLINNDATAQSLTVRGNGVWHFGTLSVLNNGAGSTTVQLGYSNTMSVSSFTAQNVYIEKNNDTARAMLNIASINDYSLGLVTAAGSGTGWREITLVVNTNGSQQMSQNATVSGLNSQYIGSTTNLAGLRIMISGSNTSSNQMNLIINTATGTTYTAAANFESTSGTDKLSITKTGLGTQYLITGTSNNVATGNATIAQGNLFVQNSNGKGLTTGNIVVQNGGRLGMSGAISLSTGNTLTVETGGTLMVGANDRRYTLQANNNIVMQDGSKLQFILGQSTASTALGNVLTLSNGATLTADNITLELIVSDQTVEGVYANIITGLASDITQNWTVSTTDSKWQATLSYLSGNVSVTMTYVPEPAVAAACLGALALLTVARRRRHR